MATGHYFGKVLRELNILERALEHETERKRLIFPHAFIINSKVNLFQYIENIKKCILFWQSLHPLLKCNIRDDGDKKVFAFVDDDIVKQLKNISFLELRSEDKVDNELLHDAWKLLFEREYNTPVYYPLNELLWTLKIIKLDSNPTMNIYKYCFLFNVNHSISDGSCVYSVTSELFGIIDEFFKGSFKEESYKSSFELYQNECKHENGSGVLKGATTKRESENTFFVPDYFIPSDVKQCGEIDERSLYSGLLNTSFYYFENNNVFFTVKQIIEENKTDFVTKAYFLPIESVGFVKLKAKAEQLNVKLTSCFAIITALAFRHIYKVFSNEPNINPKIHYSIAINSRSHMKPVIDKHIMGSWFYLINFTLALDDKYENDKIFWQEKFWDLVRTHSLDLDVKTYDDQAEAEFLNELATHSNEDYKSDKYRGHFVLSNLGDISEINSNRTFFNIEEYYRGQSLERKLNNGVYTHHALSRIGDKLFWNMSYNEYFMKKQVADSLMKNISEIICNVV